MTPKEKAEELVNRFAPYVDTFHKGILENAKQCALIAVDEILKSYDSKDLIYPKEVKYWQEVKKEINNL